MYSHHCINIIGNNFLTLKYDKKVIIFNHLNEMGQKFLVSLLLVLATSSIQAQFLMDMVDTNKDVGRGLLALYHRFDRVKISGYMQPQFQAIQKKGAKSFNGGDYAEHTDNRFMLRRGRIRFDYVHFAEQTGPMVQFVFQFDGTERGVYIRDFWGRITEKKWGIFSATAGMFARPFSYELNLSSSDRESPERGRMSQLLMKTERDMGVMLTVDAGKKTNFLKYIKWDAGVFNGQGLSASTDFDSHKDFISRLALKPVPVGKASWFSVGISYLNGGLLQNTKYIYRTAQPGSPAYFVDSAESNTGKIAPRIYYGGDAQLKFESFAGFTELRGEVIIGTQTATRSSSETPSSLLVANEAYFIRKFSGAYVYLLQDIFKSKCQLVLKYDWYDPNTRVHGKQIDAAGNFNAADIKYTTLGIGMNYYMNTNVKLLLWYERVKNEDTGVEGFTTDIPDNNFTCRLQFRF